jgi:hypothetical protein
MSAEDLEQYEADLELQLYKEYKDVCPMFSYVVETERRFYLANTVSQQVRDIGGRAFIELELVDAWVWDMYRASRFVPSVRIATFKDVNVEELPKNDLLTPPPD